MNGDRDGLHVSRSEGLRRSPSTYRKSAKACSPSKLPVCTSSLFTSSISKGRSIHGSRRGTRSSISETMILPASTERKQRPVVQGKTPTKRAAFLTFPNAVEHGIMDDHDYRESQNARDDVEVIKGCSFSDGGFSKQIPDSRRQPSCSEKVSKWLEESQHSTLTELSDNHTFPADEDHEVDGREPPLMAALVPEAYRYKDRIRLTEILPENIPTAQCLVEVPIVKFRLFRGLSLARLLMGYLKVMMCLSVVYMGIFLRIWPASWDYYEPPPT